MEQSRRRPLKVGIFLPYAEQMMAGVTPGWVELKHLARCVEEAGFDSIWVGDHLLLRFAEPAAWAGHALVVGPWECWSLLAALAAVTNRIELGPLVSCTSFRHPALLAKIAATVDEISGGRLILGLGAGWHEPEYRGLGYPYEQRVSCFAEALTIIHSLLRHGQVDFTGTYYQARDYELRPPSPRGAGLPILIAAAGERMLQLTARYADIWNGLLVGRDALAEIGTLQTHVDAVCQASGRDPATLTRTVTLVVNVWERDDCPYPMPLAGPPDVLATGLRTLAQAGVTHVQVFLHPSTCAAVEAFAPVLDILDRESISVAGSQDLGETK